MASWIDWTVGGIAIIVGLAIFYRALKEPLDIVFGWIGNTFRYITEKITGVGGETYETITYR